MYDVLCRAVSEPHGTFLLSKHGVVCWDVEPTVTHLSAVVYQNAKDRERGLTSLIVET